MYPADDGVIRVREMIRQVRAMQVRLADVIERHPMRPHDFQHTSTLCRSGPFADPPRKHVRHQPD
jgi:hypothetical protein